MTYLKWQECLRQLQQTVIRTKTFQNHTANQLYQEPAAIYHQLTKHFTTQIWWIKLQKTHNLDGTKNYLLLHCPTWRVNCTHQGQLSHQATNCRLKQRVFNLLNMQTLKSTPTSVFWSRARGRGRWWRLVGFNEVDSFFVWLTTILESFTFITLLLPAVLNPVARFATVVTLLTIAVWLLALWRALLCSRVSVAHSINVHRNNIIVLFGHLSVLHTELYELFARVSSFSRQIRVLKRGQLTAQNFTPQVNIQASHKAPQSTFIAYKLPKFQSQGSKTGDINTHVSFLNKLLKPLQQFPFPIRVRKHSSQL